MASTELAPLKTYLDKLTVEQRDKLAADCKTTAGHLKNVSYGTRTCSVTLAIALERVTRGELRCEDLCPDVDWKYLRTRGAALAANNSAG